MRFKNNISIIISILLFWLMLPSSLDVQAKDASYSSKDEVIYGKLHPNGHMNEMYVVNSFYDPTEGTITDYGSYESVRNLTDLSTIEQTKDSVSLQTTGEDFYYQGKIDNQPLPWKIDMTYFLDGVEMDADQLAGQSGQLDIHIEIKENQAVDPIFFDYYLLQISLTFDPLHFQDIEAPKGTEANEGKNKLVNFSAMPGEEDIFITTATVENLTMDPINISAIPANLAIDDPDISDMEDDMQKLSDAIRDLHDGVVDLYDGVIDMDDGTGELSKGSGEFLNGIKTLNQSSSELVTGSQTIKDAFAEINNALDENINGDLPDTDELKELPEIIRNISDELKQFSEGFNELDDLLDDLPSNGLSETDFAKVYDVLDDYKADEDVYDIVNQLVGTYTAVEALFYIDENMPFELDEIANEMVEYLDEIADELENNLAMLDELEQMDELIDGLQTLATEYDQFHEGVTEYTNGVDDLTKAYGDIDQGINDISDGTTELKDGVKELKDGTEELSDETKDLPNEMQSEIDQFMEDFDFSKFKPKSFISEKNKKIGVVQFVLQTETIEIPEDDTEETVEEETKNIWQRFLDLFR